MIEQIIDLFLLKHNFLLFNRVFILDNFTENRDKNVSFCSTHIHYNFDQFIDYYSQKVFLMKIEID